MEMEVKSYLNSLIYSFDAVNALSEESHKNAAIKCIYAAFSFALPLMDNASTIEIISKDHLTVFEGIDPQKNKSGFKSFWTLHCDRKFLNEKLPEFIKWAYLQSASELTIKISDRQLIIINFDPVFFHLKTNQ